MSTQQIHAVIFRAHVRCSYFRVKFATFVCSTKGLYTVDHVVLPALRFALDQDYQLFPDVILPMTCRPAGYKSRRAYASMLNSENRIFYWSVLSVQFVLNCKVSFFSLLCFERSLDELVSLSKCIIFLISCSGHQLLQTQNGLRYAPMEKLRDAQS